MVHVLLCVNSADMLGSSLSSSCMEEGDAGCYTCGDGLVWGFRPHLLLRTSGNEEEGGVSLSL